MSYLFLPLLIKRPTPGGRSAHLGHHSSKAHLIEVYNTETVPVPHLHALASLHHTASADRWGMRGWGGTMPPGCGAYRRSSPWQLLPGGQAPWRRRVPLRIPSAIPDQRLKVSPVGIQTGSYSLYIGLMRSAERRLMGGRNRVVPKHTHPGWSVRTIRTHPAPTCHQSDTFMDSAVRLSRRTRCKHTAY